MAEKMTDMEKIRGGNKSITTLTKQHLKEMQHVDIKIASTETQKEPVPVSVNGHAFQIKRDHWVSVPIAVAEVLEHAVTTQFSQRPRGGENEGLEMVPHEAQRFPFQQKLSEA